MREGDARRIRMGATRLAHTASKAFQRKMFKLCVLIILIVAVIVALFVLRVQDDGGDLLHWIESHKEVGAFALVACYVVFAGRYPDWSSLCRISPEDPFRAPLLWKCNISILIRHKGVRV
jgi:hypothetical protein